MTDIFVVSCFITAAVSIVLGFFVLLSRLKTSHLWFLTTLSIALWSFSLGMEVSSNNYNTALFWNKILDTGAIFIPIFFYHFVVSFLDINKTSKEKKFLWLGYSLSIFFLASTFFTNLFVKGVPPAAGFKYWIEVGPIYYLFFIFFVVYLSRSAILLAIFSKRNTGVKKNQARYILIAIVFGAGGGISNFLPQIFFPSIYPVGNYLVVLYTLFITYAIFKHQLFNIKILATELFTFAIFITLLIKTLFSQGFRELFVNGVIFISVTVFSILLIRSVLKEVKQREQLERLTKEIKEAYEVEKKARKELERLDEAKTQFMMATQHHLRTPLTAIRGYLDLLLTGSFGRISPRVKEALIKVQISGNRLIRIVNEFLDVSQFQLGKEVVSIRQDVDLDPIFKEIMEELKFEADTKKIYLKLEKEKDLPKIAADPEKLKMALFNLIDNGIKYTTKGGVTIKSGVTDHHLKISIADTGIGISKDDQAKLFSRVFERGEDAKKVHGTGRGIGLYIASHIINAHHGKIWAESNSGQGTVFNIEIPIGREDNR